MQVRRTAVSSYSAPQTARRIIGWVSTLPAFVARYLSRLYSVGVRRDLVAVTSDGAVLQVDAQIARLR